MGERDTCRVQVHLRILDTDGSVDAQALGNAAPWASATRVDLRDLGPALRLWSRRKSIDSARARIAAAPDPRPSLTFLGSGDFHHLAALLIERVEQPFTVLHFDNHPDWVRLAPRWHCGSWVNRVLALPNVQRVVTVGPCSDDLVSPGRKGGNLSALDSGRLALFPWQHAPSRVWRRIAEGPGHTWTAGRIVWRNLAERQLEHAVAMVLDAVPTGAVWITIDKDVLPEHEALTNWDQGRMPLAALTAMLRAAGQRKRILGADVCGEYSSPRHVNWLKRIEARMDQPVRDVTDRRRIDDNVHTDCDLAQALFGACAHPT
jgi:arginase family enzyme